MAHDWGLDFVAKLQLEVLLVKTFGEQGTELLLETDGKGLHRTEGEGVEQLTARAKGLVGN